MDLLLPYIIGQTQKNNDQKGPVAEEIGNEEKGKRNVLRKVKIGE